MSSNILREFFHRSREWARATRGIELFRMAAIDLRNFANVDSGFFIYRKRSMESGLASQSPNIHVPWGVFAKDEEVVKSLVGDESATLQTLNTMMEQWILIQDMPEAIKNKWTEFGVVEAGIWPLVSREQIIGVLVVARTQRLSKHLNHDIRTHVLDACAAQISVALDLILARKMAEEASQRDLLTGLLNRRGIEARLLQLAEHVRNAGNYLVFGLIDLDDLKSVNDSLGHPAGDEALRQVANIISHNVRANDLVARFGGDEFAVVLQAERPDADSFMIRIQQAVQRESNGHTVSVGGAIWGIDGDTLEQCYEVADSRLYDCKRLAKSI